RKECFAVSPRRGRPTGFDVRGRAEGGIPSHGRPDRTFWGCGIVTRVHWPGCPLYTAPAECIHPQKRISLAEFCNIVRPAREGLGGWTAALIHQCAPGCR